MDVLGEFGLFGYLLLVSFLLAIAVQVHRYARDQAALLIYILVAYSFLSGFSDTPFWLAIGVLLAYIRMSRDGTPDQGAPVLSPEAIRQS